MFFSNLKGLISTYTWASWTLNTCVSVGTSSCRYLQVTTTHLYEKLLLNLTPHGKCERIQTLRHNDLSKQNLESPQYWLQYVFQLQMPHRLIGKLHSNHSQNIHYIHGVGTLQQIRFKMSIAPAYPKSQKNDIKMHQMDCKFKQIIKLNDGYMWNISHKHMCKNAAFLVFHLT